MSTWKNSVKNLVYDIMNKKFLVFCAAVALLVLGKIDQQIWLYVAIGYMSASVLEQLVTKIVNKE